MDSNYYFLKKLTDHLKNDLTGKTLTSCFSQNKDELVLTFEEKGAEPFVINAILRPEICCLTFPQEYARSRKNSVDLFERLIDACVTNVKQILNDRSFILCFENNWSLLFKMHGNLANILLFQENELQGIFKNNLEKDKALKINELDRPIDQRLDAFERTSGSVKALFPTFGKIVNAHVENSIPFEQNHDVKQKWEFLSNLLTELENGEFYICHDSGGTHLTLLGPKEYILKTKNPYEALNVFYRTFAKNYYLKKNKEVVLKRLNKKLKQSTAYITKVEKKLEALKKGVKHEEIANIIMANLHLISEGQTEASLLNFYTNEEISIKLKRDLSPQKNAEQYYRKGKNQKIELQKLEDNLMRKSSEAEEIQLHVHAIDEIENSKSLSKYLTANNLETKKKDKIIAKPYRLFEIDGFEILVGKGAKQNDALLKDHSWKEDMWLHARGVAGSHVIIKHQAGQSFTTNLIEKAAQLAAFYSKGKNDSLCPVIYTERKFVRKPKGATPGLVVVQKEKVILVEPSNLIN